MEELNELFYKDPYLKSFAATVTSCSEGKNGFEVVLDDTAFYPEGGGQPADHGTLGAAQVTDVRRVKGVIIHYTDKPLEAGTKVEGKIDWERRFDNMQNHTGEHVLSGLVHAKFKYENVGFHMDDDIVTVDFNGPMTEEEMKAIEKAANDAVAADVPVEELFPSASELETLDYRSKKELTGRVRIIDIPGLDRCACCGTHVKKTGEIGMIKCLTLSKHRGGVRIEFVCGGRALRSFAKKVEEAQAVSQLLSAKPDEISAAVRKVLAEVQARDAKIAELNLRYFRMRADALPSGGKFLLAEEEGLTPGDLKTFCNLLTEEKKADVCAVIAAVPGSDPDTAWNYMIASETADLKTAGKPLNQALNGRGGGNGKFLQGTYKAPKAEIEKALNAAFNA